MPHSNKNRIFSFTNLVASEISFPSIFSHWIDLYSWTKKNDTYSGSISRLTLIFWPISSLSYTLHECLTNVASTGIQSYSQFNSISTWSARFQYFLIPISPSSFAVSRWGSLITQLYLPTRLTGLNTWATSTGAVVSAMPFDYILSSLTSSEIITYFNAIILV